jgi:ribose transport system substrate-binding protein
MIQKTLAIACATLALGAATATAQAADKPLKSVGVTLGDLANPFFVAIAKGAESGAHKINPDS